MKDYSEQSRRVFCDTLTALSLCKARSAICYAYHRCAKRNFEFQHTGCTNIQFYYSAQTILMSVQLLSAFSLLSGFQDSTNKLRLLEKTCSHSRFCKSSPTSSHAAQHTVVVGSARVTPSSYFA